MAKTKKLKKLSDWDWTTLVAAWRYYEYHSTIASATFPRDIYERYFTGDYSEKCCKRIAHQFYSVDHGIRGEADWAGSKLFDFADRLVDCDIKPWVVFYAFCKAYCEGFSKVHLIDGSVHEVFYCETLKQWILLDKYVGDGDGNIYIAPDWIVKVESEVK